MDKMKTVWNCAKCGKTMEVGHREYRDLECCGVVAPKEFVPMTNAEHQEFIKDGCYNLEAEIDYQRHMHRVNRISKREVM